MKRGLLLIGAAVLAAVLLLSRHFGLAELLTSGCNLKAQQAALGSAEVAVAAA